MRVPAGELARLLEAWAATPEHERRAILEELEADERPIAPIDLAAQLERLAPAHEEER